MINSIEDEIKLIIMFLSHPGGFDIDMAGILGLRPIDECCPPQRWEVNWEEGINNNLYKEFDDLSSAVEFFVEKRHELELGLDFEHELWKAGQN